MIAEYDAKNLTRTARLLESKLAEQVGKPGGLPEGFDPHAFCALVARALLSDLQDQFARHQEQIQEQERKVQSILDEIRELRDDNQDIGFDKWQEILVTKYKNLKATVEAKLPKIWPGLEFGLSNLRILNIDDCTLPMIGILLGRPGSGKTVIATLLSKWLYGFYTDQFSAKAWISHTTSVDTEQELEAIDMLPKIKDKQFLTPELATLFGLKEDDLRIALSNITRIADGHGFASDSGVYGHRSYGDTMFVWLGAVVDIPSIVYKILHDLGPRFYFNRMPFTDITTQDLFLYLTDKEKFNTKYQAIQSALFDYLKWFEIGPTLHYRTPGSPHLVKMRWDDEKDDPNAMQCISNLAMLLAHLRREGNAYRKNKDVDDEDDKSYSYFAKPIEDVTKAGTVLTNLARGHALIPGNNHITMDDVRVVLTTVLSTARVQRVKALIALLDNGGDITVVQLSQALNISHSSATRLAIELRAIELVDVKHTNNVEYTKNNNPSMQTVVSLDRNKFDWFLSEEFKKLRGDFTPVDNRKYIDHPDPEKQAAKDAAKEADRVQSEAHERERDIRDFIAENRDNIYKKGHSDIWACKCCRAQAGREIMEFHRCSKSKVNTAEREKANAEARAKYNATSRRARRRI